MGTFSSRSRLALLVIVCLAAGAAAAAGYALTAPKRYRATAQLLVAPVTSADSTFAGLGVLRETGGARTAAASVAALLRGPQVADAVAAALGLHRSRSSLEQALHVHVVDSSDVVDVSGEDATATGAAELANAFAAALISQRSAAFQSQLSNAIHRNEELLTAMTAAERTSGVGAAIARRVAALKGYLGQADPTIRVASEAASPSAASSPNVARLIGLGAAVGAAAGILASLVLLALRPRRRSEAAVGQAPNEQALEQLVDRLDARISAREAALAARERDLQAKLDELRAAPGPGTVGPGDSDLRRREALLSERIAGVTRREVEVELRAAALAARERKLEEAEPGRASARTNGAGRHSVAELEELVARRRGEYPDRLDEWQFYLFFLRDYASADGRLPAAFDRLIDAAFAEIL